MSRPKLLPGLNYVGEAGDTLETLLPGIAIDVLVDGDPQVIRLTDPIGTGDRPQRFLRLRITAGTLAQ